MVKQVNNGFMNITEGTELYDKRHDDKVTVTNVSYNGEIMLTTNTDEWVDATEYIVTEPLNPERFELV